MLRLIVCKAYHENTKYQGNHGLSDQIGHERPTSNKITLTFNCKCFDTKPSTMKGSIKIAFPQKTIFPRKKSPSYRRKENEAIPKSLLDNIIKPKQK